MSAESTSPLTENRKPHTVYLTGELWSAIERGHLELRLREPAAPSKIEYIERVLQAGLERLSAPSRQQARRTPLSPTAAQVATPEPVTAQAPAPAAKPPAVTQRRPTALERLKQASDPGQPAPIRSVADTT